MPTATRSGPVSTPPACASGCWRALFDVHVSHADAGRLESDLRARGVDVRDATYAERVTLRVAVAPDTDLDALLAELTGGTVRALPAGTVVVRILACTP